MPICECGKTLKKITNKHRNTKYHLANTTENKDIDDIVLKIAKYCIDNNIYRTDEQMGGIFNFFKKELKDIANCSWVDGGYAFLDKECKEETEKVGMVRLYVDNCNPKWTFWTENGEIKHDWA